MRPRGRCLIGIWTCRSRSPVGGPATVPCRPLSSPKANCTPKARRALSLASRVRACSASFWATSGGWPSEPLRLSRCHCQYRTHPSHGTANTDLNGPCPWSRPWPAAPSPSHGGSVRVRVAPVARTGDLDRAEPGPAVMASVAGGAQRVTRK